MLLFFSVIIMYNAKLVKINFSAKVFYIIISFRYSCSLYKQRAL